MNLPPPPTSFPPSSLLHSVDSFDPPPAKRLAPLLLSSVPQEQHIPPFHGHPRRTPQPEINPQQPQQLLQQQQQLHNRDVSPALGRGADEDDDVDVSSEAGGDALDTGNVLRNGDGKVNNSAAAGSAVAAAAATDAMLVSRDADSPTPHPFDGASRSGRESPRQFPHGCGMASGETGKRLAYGVTLMLPLESARCLMWVGQGQ